MQETKPKKTFQKTTRQQWRELVIDLNVMPTIRLVLLRLSALMLRGTTVSPGSSI